jgi:hypothetical protein
MDDTRAVMLDLDPEPSPARSRRPWEVLVAGVLLLGVLGFAATDWWQNERLATVYQQGAAAAAARHWDAAAAAFNAAGRYLDAPQRLGEARSQARQRATLLAEAQEAATPGTLWRLLRAAAAIEPDYPGLTARLAAVEVQLFAQGPSGTIYLQRSGPQPGLYLVHLDGRTRLPGSDATSRVYGIAPDGQSFLYDAGGAAPTARPIVLATLQPGDNHLTTRVLAGDFAAGGQGIFLRDGTGFWWVTNTQIRYVDRASGQGVDPLAAYPQWRVVALDAAQGRLLLGPRQADTTAGTVFYLTGAAGGAGRELRLGTTGAVLSATFSQDGSYLVYMTQQTGTQVERVLWRVDLAAPGASLTGLEWLPWESAQTAGRLSVFVVPNDPAHGLLVDRNDGRGEDITAFDLQTGKQRLVWSGPGHIVRYNTAAISPDGRYLALHDQQDRPGLLMVAPIARTVPTRAFPAPIFSGQSVHLGFSPHSDYLVYEVRYRDNRGQGLTEPIYTLPLDAPSGTAPQLLTSAANVPSDPGQPTSALPPGGDLLLYVTSHAELHAATFDGAVDKILGTGISAVWSLRDATTWAWVR